MKQCNSAIMQRGVTLIELLVTIAIIILLLAGGVPAYRQYGYVNDLNQAAQDVKNAILETQSFALAPPGDTSAGFKASDFTIYFSSIDSGLFKKNHYYIFPSNTPSLGPILKEYILPNGIHFDLMIGRFAYSIEQRGKIIDPIIVDTPGQQLDTGSVMTLLIISDKISQTKTITVNRETGQITIR